MATAAADSGPQILSVSLTPNPVELGSTVTISVSAQDVSSPSYNIAAIYKRNYTDYSKIALLKVDGNDITLDGPAPMYTGKVYNSIQVGYQDLNPYGPTDLHITVDGKNVSATSEPNDVYMSPILPVRGDIRVIFTYDSTGGSMPFNTMEIDVLHMS